MTNCSACGLPPLPNQALKQCSRCKAAWYHDVECQKKHYLLHKTECRRVIAGHASSSAAVENLTAAAASSPVVTTNIDATDDDLGVITFNDDEEDKSKIKYTHPLSECQVLENKGRSLIAKSHMYMGAHPLNPSNEDVNEDGWCEPLVPPVLTKEARNSRCSYCFTKLKYVCTDRLLHHYCSNECKNRDKYQSLEESSIRMIRMVIPNIELPSPTVVLVSRILRYSAKSTAVLRKFDDLCYKVDDLSSKQKEEYLQIITNSHSLLRYMGSEDEASARAKSMMENPTDAYKFMSRITMNGFTVSTSEQEGIGIGIYSAASMINHSCRPNAVQSFYFFPSGRTTKSPNVPMLQITTCREVEVGQEITISYCDVSAPRHERKKELWEGYNFDCNCSWCKDLDAEEKLLGFICSDSSCRGRIVKNLVNKTPSSNLVESLSYICNRCGFARHAQCLAEFTQNVRNMEKRMREESYGEDIRFVEDTGYHLHKTLHLLKQICSAQTSWYVAWCADAYVHFSIKAMSLYDNDDKNQVQACIEALKVMDECRSAMRYCFKYPGSIKWYLLQATEAKLRLFLNCRDMDAFNVLWDARRYLELFFPSNDYLIDSLDNSAIEFGYVNDFDAHSDPLWLDYGHLSQDEVRNLWIVNGCKDYSNDPNKDNFLHRHLD